jgi:hypothetical protein
MTTQSAERPPEVARFARSWPLKQGSQSGRAIGEAAGSSIHASFGQGGLSDVTVVPAIGRPS